MAGDSAGGKEVGRISIRVVPDLKDFRSKLAAELKAIEDSLRGTVKIDVDVDADGAKAHLRELLAELRAMAAKDVKVKVDVDGNAFRREADAIATGAAGAAGGLGGMGRGLAIVAAVAAFAAPALALITGVLVSLPAVIAGVLVPVAAIALGLDGIKKAAEVMKPGLDSLKAAMSDRFKDVLTPVFQKLNDDLFPALKQTMPGVASALGLVAKSFTDVITSGPGLDSLKGTIQNIRDTISQSAPGIGKLTSGLLGLANGVTSKFPAVGKWLDSVGDSFDKWVAKVNTVDASGTSPLDRAMGNLGDTLKGVLDIIGDLAKAGFDFLQDPEFGKSMTTFIRDVQTFIRDTLPLFKSGFQEVAGYVHDIVDTIDKINSFKVPDWIKGGNSNDNKPNPSAKGIFPGFNQDLFDNGATNPIEDTTKSWNLMIAKLKELWDPAWETIKGKAKQALDLIASYFLLVPNAMFNAWNLLTTIGQTVWTTISTNAQVQLAILVAKVRSLPGQIVGIWETIKVAANTAWVTISTNAQVQFAILVQNVRDKGGEIIAEVKSWPGRIVGAIGDLAGQLASAASHAASSFIDALAGGISAGIGRVKGAISSVMGGIANLIPHSPAKEGPLSGSGWVAGSGEAIVDTITKGIESSAGGLYSAIKEIMQAIKDVFGDASGLNLNFNLGGAGGQAAIPNQIQDITSATKDFQNTVNDGMKPGKITDATKAQQDQLKMQQAQLEMQAKQATIDSKGASTKAEKEKLQALAAQLRLQKDQLGLQADQLGYADKYGASVEGTNTAFDDASKKLGQVPMDFFKATGQQAMSDLGISGNGAIPQGLQAGLDWVTQLGQTTINVNSIDEGLAAKQNLTNKRAMQYTQR